MNNRNRTDGEKMNGSDRMPYDIFSAFGMDDEAYEKVMESLRKLNDPTKLTEQDKCILIEKRKKLLNLSEGLYTTEGFVTREAKQDELREVERFEKRTGAKVYHISESLQGRYLILFYVPATKGELQAQINTMENCGEDWQYAYVINRDIPQYSECGPVHVMRLHSALACPDYI